MSKFINILQGALTHLLPVGRKKMIEHETTIIDKLFGKDAEASPDFHIDKWHEKGLLKAARKLEEAGIVKFVKSPRYDSFAFMVVPVQREEMEDD